MAERVVAKIGRQDLIIETGKMAKLADGAVTVQYGGTVVLVTVVCSKEVREGVNFLPLTVEYREKTYAAGKIPGGFFKREGRPSEKEVLSSRMIDRPIRPLFPEGFFNELQILAMVLSADEENDPDCLAMVGASSALAISDIPFPLLVGAVRVGMVDGNFVVNPTFSELEKSPLNLVVAGTKDGVTMVEAGAKELEEKVVLEAIEFGYRNLCEVIDLEENLAKLSGKPKRKIELKVIDPELFKKVRELSLPKLAEINKMGQKEQREEAIDLLSDELVEKLVTEVSAWTKEDIRVVLEEIEGEEIRKLIIEKGTRVDGRDFKTIRPISCEVGILPRTHGSALFTRGQTQSLVTTTLGSRTDEQMIDALEGKSFKRFMLHYDFPPFSVGEVRPIRGPGRREIGHGALSERAISWVMPSEEEFPYTVRIVSEILESNGSTSMATVCGGSLALMDAGIPIKAAVGGIAMGLVKTQDKAVILTDIVGLEDAFGHMDLKCAGTRKGVTAVQMDVKIEGISSQILSQAMEEAKVARLFILDRMDEAIAKPRESISQYAPKIHVLKVPQDKIGAVIGPGGRTVRGIQEKTGAKIEIEDDGSIVVASCDSEALKRAVDAIRALTEEVEVGKIYLGKVKKVMPFGAFCELRPGQEGLIHISELTDGYVKKVEDVVKEGEDVLVKVISIDEQGRINLSRKQAVEEREGEGSRG